MFKIEFDAVANNQKDVDVLADLLDVDVMDEDDDGLILFGYVMDDEGADALLASDLAIRELYIEHQFMHLFEDFETNDCDGNSFNISVDDEPELLAKIIAIAKENI